MLSSIKVVTLLVVFGVAWAAGEEAEPTPVEVADTPSEEKEAVEAGSDEPKNQEKRGLFRLTGVHGENPQYQFVYTVPQQIPGVPQQVPGVAQGYEPRTAATVPIPKYEPLVRMFPSAAYSAPSAYPQAYSSPAASASYSPGVGAPAPIPLSAPTPMILMMVPPHPGHPYPQLMLVPYNNIVANNHILPYQQPRVPIQLVPQFVPLPVKGYSQYPSAHFKTSEYSSKPQASSQQYVASQSSQYLSSPGPQQYLTSQSPQYQESAASSEEQDVGVTSVPSYNTRVPYRPQGGH